VPSLTSAPAAIEVEDLPPPDATAPGVPWAEAELGGPLWANGAPAELSELLRRLPTAIGEPTLAQLQKALLAAPGPASGTGDGLLGLRVDLLLRMAEPETALELLGLVPEPQAAEFAGSRMRALLAAGRTGPACEAATSATDTASPWPEMQVLCAALAHDATAVELGLDRLVALDLSVNPNLAGLARAAAAGIRFELHPPVGDDAVLLPLLRSVAINVDPAAIAALPVPARRALAANPGLSSAARAAAAAPARPGPSIRPEFNGVVPTDWAAARSAVPPEQRDRWVALVDGLGVPIPEAVWRELSATALRQAAPAPDLFLWRGFERAGFLEQRGGVLLFALLLLDGRPETAAAVTLRRVLDGLLGLGLERDARALAAGTAGALGL
jgi:hypothetical protein